MSLRSFMGRLLGFRAWWSELPDHGDWVLLTVLGAGVGLGFATLIAALLEVAP